MKIKFMTQYDQSIKILKTFLSIYLRIYFNNFIDYSIINKCYFRFNSLKPEFHWNFYSIFLFMIIYLPQFCFRFLNKF